MTKPKLHRYTLVLDCPFKWTMQTTIEDIWDLTDTDTLTMNRLPGGGWKFRFISSRAGVEWLLTHMRDHHDIDISVEKEVAK